MNTIVYRITQDKTWINDDDPGVTYVGWDHECNLGKGEFNNDVRSSKIPGAVCEYAFTGHAIEVIGTKDAQMGRIKTFIDGPIIARPTR